MDLIAKGCPARAPRKQAVSRMKRALCRSLHFVVFDHGAGHSVFLDSVIGRGDDFQRRRDTSLQSRHPHVKMEFPCFVDGAPWVWVYTVPLCLFCYY
ncbi:hypothetical protein ACE6H2_014670 [Prunus campanulata]